MSTLTSQSAFVCLNKDFEIVSFNQKGQELIESNKFPLLNKGQMDIRYLFQTTNLSPQDVCTATRVHFKTADKQSYRLLFHPLTPREVPRPWLARLEQQNWCLLLHIAPRNEHVSLTFLKQTYGLTQAEAHIAQLLCMGLPLIDVAETKSCKESTIRSATKTIFHKVGVNRQGELVARILMDYMTAA